MENSLEFTIPEGYEIDKEKSTGRKVVYKKIKKYVPKKGDLVFAQNGTDIRQRFIFVFGDENMISLDYMNNQWKFTQGTTWCYNKISPVSSMERDLFIRMLSEHGYEYDPVERVVRKKRWRAKMGETYYYINTLMTSNHSYECYTRIDNELYTVGNYFQTLEQAEEKIKEFKEILSKN